MKKHILFSLVAIILSFTNCTKPEEGGKDNPPAPQEQITIPSTVDVKPVVSPEGGETKITFTAAAAWTASVISTKADSWVDVNPKSGNPGPAEIRITTTPNDTYVERNATIQIKCGTETKDIVLTQKQLDNITVTTDKVELGVEGGTFTIELKSNIDFSYEIVGDWIKYVSTKAYTDKTLTFSVEANDSVQKREGSVTVKGGEFSETVKVYQSGEEPTLIITQNEYNLEAEGGSIVVEVSSNVAVKMTIPEDALWITENQTKSVSTSTFYLEIAANETAEARSAEITFSNEESGLSEKVTVNQEGNGSINVPEMVDLGLPSGLKWATCNIGASKPEEYGDYYAWGETETYYEDGYAQEDPQNHWKTGYATDGYDWSNYKWCNGRDDNRTKYCVSSYYGTVDNKSTLDLDDDVAHVTLGGKWRMPTVDEVDELKSYCTWTWTDNYNGTGVAGQIVTSKVPGYTDKSIFLPAAGYRTGKSLYSVGTGCSYWSSSLSVYSLSTVWNNFCYGGSSSSNNAGIGTSGADFGRTVRPVYGEFINVSSVTLNRDNINLKWGEPETLVADLMPWNATNQQIAWHSSNPDVASVDIYGDYVIINPIYNGTAIVTAYAGDGTLSASCSVTVSGAPGPDEFKAVDLGLSVKWASCNLGANKANEYGGYYQWAGLKDVSDTSIDLWWNNCPYHTGSDRNTGWTKYIPSGNSTYWSGTGTPDNKTVLDPEDDVAHVTLGNNWRMPTMDEWEELMRYCTWTWTSNYRGTGVAGQIVISKVPGYTDQSIFLPAAGNRSDTSIYYDGNCGNYLSSSLYTDWYPFFTYGLYFFEPDYIQRDYYNFYRYEGQSIRPVSD